MGPGHYYSDTNSSSQVLRDLVIPTNGVFTSGIFVPENAVQLIVTVIATAPVVGLPVSVISPSSAVTLGVNQV
jgi:hypothetical protein